MIIPFESLNQDTLESLIIEFVTRDGTDYGEIEFTRSEKISQVKERLKSKDIIITYDEESETCNLAAKNSF